MAVMLNHPLVAWSALLALGGAIFWAGRIQEHKSGVADYIKEIREDIKKVLGRLPNDPVIGTGSPIRLTELGNTISAEVRGKEWAEEKSDSLVDDCRDLRAYEIQEKCFAYAKRPDVLDDEMQGRVLNSAYKHGQGRDSVLNVLAVELRDNILTKLERTEELPIQ